MTVDYSKFAATPEEAKLFHVKPFDREAAREKMVARIARTMKQLNGEKVSPQGGKDFERHYNNGVTYRPTFNGHRIKLAGEGSNGFETTSSKLLAMLVQMGKDVEAGKFDDQLESAQAATSTGSTGTRRSGGISPEAAKERGIRAAATRAANKAAREAGKK